MTAEELEIIISKHERQWGGSPNDKQGNKPVSLHDGINEGINEGIKVG